jgi:nicotinamidase-related amidase
MTSALVVIDMQQGLLNEQPAPYRSGEVLQNVGDLLGRARAAHVPVFHVQHDGGAGDSLAKGSAGWPHHPAVAPREGEPVIEKRQSSAFHDTDFHDRLQRVGVDRLVIAGMQTEYCVDSACRAAAALGYHVVLVSDAHTTFDSSALPAERIIAHHNGTLGDAFVELAAARDVKF